MQYPFTDAVGRRFNLQTSWSRPKRDRRNATRRDATNRLSRSRRFLVHKHCSRVLLREHSGTETVSAGPDTFIHRDSISVSPFY